jgi:hypothetical protein
MILYLIILFFLSFLLVRRKMAIEHERILHLDAVKASAGSVVFIRRIRLIKCSRKEYSGFVLAVLVFHFFSKVHNGFFPLDKVFLTGVDKASSAHQSRQPSYYPSLPDTFHGIGTSEVPISFGTSAHSGN